MWRPAPFRPSVVTTYIISLSFFPLGRLYAAAMSWDVFQRTGHGAEHVGPETLLLRRIFNGLSSRAT